MIKLLFAITIYSFSCTIYAGIETTYGGQQHREIKSLSQSEIDGYLNGEGMGFAKAAELNHYPGPRHVLDLASELNLDKKQREQTQTLFEKMQASAIELGKQLVSQERRLDQLFAQDKVTKESLNNLLQEIGLTRAKLRNVHLSTHLEQKKILNKHQIKMYDQLRGYGNGSHGKDHHNMHNHSH